MKKIRNMVKVAAAVYVAAVLLAAVVLGAVGASKLVLACNTARISDEMYAYWQTQQRYRYIGRHTGMLGGADTPLFWRTPAKDGTNRTHGQAVEDLTREYVEYVAAASYLFDLMGYTLSDSDRAVVEEYFDEKAHFAFGGERGFDDAAEKFGFTLAAARNAELLVKKVELLREYTTADALQQDAYFCDNYVRIKLAYVKANDPSYEDKCSMIRLSLAEPTTAEALDEGSDEFSRVVTDAVYNADDTMRKTPNGYYFAKLSQFTTDTRSALPTLVDAIFDLEKVGDSHEMTVEVTLEDGSTETRTYFLRRYAPETLAYAYTAGDKNEMFFTDFVSLATDHYFFEWCDSVRGECTWKDAHIREWVPTGSNSDMFKFF